MLSHKKGLVLSALMRVIIAIVTLVVVFSACSEIADIFMGNKASANNFPQFVDEFNSLKNFEARESIITLPEDAAIIGFSEGAGQFRCIACGNQYSPNEYYFEIEKPDNAACESTSCACVCFGTSLGGQERQRNADVRPFNCEQASCKKITHKILESTSLEAALRDEGRQLVNYPKWENGFIFIRSDSVSNGYTPAGSKRERRFTVSIERQDIDGEPRVAACPVLPCFPQDIFT